MNAAPLSMIMMLAAAPALAEESHSLELRSKAAIAAATPLSAAPYVRPSSEPERQPLVTPQMLHPDAARERSHSSCQSDHDLCYDPGAGRIVYKPARQLMPSLPGMQAYSIAIRRDRIAFKYTF